jgi:hypothetical protein
LNIIEDTKAWKAANHMLGSKWKLQQPIMAKRTTFSEIMAKTPSASATTASSTQQTTSPSILTLRTASPTNPYAKKLASWRTKPVFQNMQRNHVTYFEIKLPVFCEGARVKNWVTHITDNNKTTHSLDEQQQQEQNNSLHRVTSIQRV